MLDNNMYEKFIGTQGTVYKINSNECIKLYHDNYLNNNLALDNYINKLKITKNMFNLFKKLNLNNFCKLYDLLLEDNNILGYTMKYYEKTKDNILLMPTDYILDSFYNIYKSIIKLSENKILVNDLCLKNTINTKDKIIVIDLDTYMQTKSSNYDSILNFNTNELVNTFISLFESELIKLNITLDNDLKYKIREIFNKNSINDVNKKLTLSKPIDSIYKKK